MVDLIEKESIKSLKDCKCLKYMRNDAVENQEFFKPEIEKKTKLLTKNLAGHGVDFKMNEEVAKNGGIHVCILFLPSNLRVQKHAFGRTVRKGRQLNSF
jgi:hypothetical protein